MLATKMLPVKDTEDKHLDKFYIIFYSLAIVKTIFACRQCVLDEIH